MFAASATINDLLQSFQRTGVRRLDLLCTHIQWHTLDLAMPDRWTINLFIPNPSVLPTVSQFHLLLLWLFRPSIATSLVFACVFSSSAPPAPLRSSADALVWFCLSALELGAEVYSGLALRQKNTPCWPQNALQSVALHRNRAESLEAPFLVTCTVHACALAVTVQIDILEDSRDSRYRTGPLDAKSKSCGSAIARSRPRQRRRTH